MRQSTKVSLENTGARCDAADSDHCCRARPSHAGGVRGTSFTAGGVRGLANSGPGDVIKETTGCACAGNVCARSSAEKLSPSLEPHRRARGRPCRPLRARSRRRGRRTRERLRRPIARPSRPRTAGAHRWA
eukprot:Amastigsp_a686828_5.p5 type:complete len:131 gc:universal Amastigsp_a686828_5:444-836(+)